MELNFAPDVEKKLSELAERSGSSPTELVQGVIRDMLEDLDQARDVLDSRYDDIKSGRVKLIPGEEVEAYFRSKFEAMKQKRAHP